MLSNIIFFRINGFLRCFIYLKNNFLLDGIFLLLGSERSEFNPWFGINALIVKTFSFNLPPSPVTKSFDRHRYHIVGRAMPSAGLRASRVPFVRRDLRAVPEVLRTFVICGWQDKCDRHKRSTRYSSSLSLRPFFPSYPLLPIFSSPIIFFPLFSYPLLSFFFFFKRNFPRGFRSERTQLRPSEH